MTRAKPDQQPQPPHQLRALLDLVGPNEAPALLSQLHADLLSCDLLIDAALHTHDRLALRRASHNLTALAGTAGAEELQRLAEALNLAAHASEGDDDGTDLATLGPRTHAALASLIALINRLSLTIGAG